MKYLLLLFTTVLLISCNDNKINSQETEKLTAQDQKKYSEIGLEFAKATQTLLGKNLMEKIQKEGATEALAFCNIEAMPLTATMSTKYNADIKRVSDKNRNPDNKANEEELKYIAKFKKEAADNIESTPIVISQGEKVHFYYPILTNTMCLQCHGKAEDIKPKVAVKINNLYPNDLAIGYSENEVRGIWSIVFDK